MRQGFSGRDGLAAGGMTGGAAETAVRGVFTDSGTKVLVKVCESEFSGLEAESFQVAAKEGEATFHQEEAVAVDEAFGSLDGDGNDQFGGLVVGERFDQEGLLLETEVAEEFHGVEVQGLATGGETLGEEEAVLDGTGLGGQGLCGHDISPRKKLEP